MHGHSPFLPCAADLQLLVQWLPLAGVLVAAGCNLLRRLWRR